MVEKKSSINNFKSDPIYNITYNSHENSYDFTLFVALYE